MRYLQGMPAPCAREPLGLEPMHREPDPPQRPPSPWPEGGGRQRSDGPGPREPAIRAPWPALLVAASAPLGYALQHLGGDPLAAAARFGFRPALLDHGGWTGLLTSLFVHGGWAHALLNALAALAFGAPVARRFGATAAGAAAFAVFFVLCGVLGSLGFALWPGRADTVLAGASGGVAGLMGASSRMLVPPGARLAPLLSRPVATMAAAWLVTNLALALVGLDVATAGAPVAWQAHLAGYAAGLLLIGPALRLFRAPTG